MKRLVPLLTLAACLGCSGMSPRDEAVPGAGRGTDLNSDAGGRNCERVAAKGSHIKTIRCEGERGRESSHGLSCRGAADICARVERRGDGG